MHRFLALALFGILILTPLGVGSPVDGTFSRPLDLIDETFTATKIFRNGERASVLAFAVGDAPGAMTVRVFGPANQLVAEDKSDGNLSGSIVGVIWYPPAEGEYRVEVRHPAARKIYVAIK